MIFWMFVLAPNGNQPQLPREKKASTFPQTKLHGNLNSIKSPGLFLIVQSLGTPRLGSCKKGNYLIQFSRSPLSLSISLFLGCSGDLLAASKVLRELSFVACCIRMYKKLSEAETTYFITTLFVRNYTQSWKLPFFGSRMRPTFFFFF